MAVPECFENAVFCAWRLGGGLVAVPYRSPERCKNEVFCACRFGGGSAAVVGWRFGGGHQNAVKTQCSVHVPQKLKNRTLLTTFDGGWRYGGYGGTVAVGFFGWRCAAVVFFRGRGMPAAPPPPLHRPTGLWPLCACPSYLQKDL